MLLLRTERLLPLQRSAGVRNWGFPLGKIITIIRDISIYKLVRNIYIYIFPQFLFKLNSHK